MTRNPLALLLAALIAFTPSYASASSCNPNEADVAEASIMHYRESKCAEQVLDQADGALDQALAYEQRGEVSHMCSAFYSAIMQLDRYKRGEWRDGYARIAEKIDDKFADRVARFEKTTCPQKIQLYRHLALKGDAWAMYRLGSSYATGTGVAQDDNEALAWYQQAADRNYPDAYMALGVMYSDGKAFVPDYRIAFNWFSKAAELGNAEAQFQLGSLYRKGYGVTKNSKQAADWYRKAAEQGHAGAQAGLKQMYQAGEARKPLFGY